jgi:hypothetical protein
VRHEIDKIRREKKLFSKILENLEEELAIHQGELEQVTMESAVV